MSVLFSPALDAAIRALQDLPGIGPKSAQRLLFHLLSYDKDRSHQLVSALQTVLTTVQPCERCQMFTEERLCRCCQSDRRDDRLLCVVSSPADVLAIEQTGRFQGYFFVLMGLVSPIDGIGPEEIGLKKLKKRLEFPGLEEVILALPSTVEGEATSFLISEAAKLRALSCTRLAQGVPVGSELSFVDIQTLSCALHAREMVSQS